MRKPSSTRNIALQILDTKLSKESFDKLTEWLKKMNSNIFRLVIIGARFRDKWLLNKIMKRKFLKLNMQYIYDWDTAKDWLVGKRK